MGADKAQKPDSASHPRGTIQKGNKFESKEERPHLVGASCYRGGAGPAGKIG